MNAPAYFDHNATTPVHPDVADAMLPYLREHFGNPSCVYSHGVQASYALEKARMELAQLLGVDEREIFFTSGGTESDNMALKGAVLATGKRHLVTAPTEHPAVVKTAEWMVEHMGCTLTLLPVDRYGRVHPEDLRHAITKDTALVSLMMANNETGTIHPIAELAAITHSRGALLHTDAVQAVGRIPVDAGALGVDCLSLSGHKFHGPKGVGALYIRNGCSLQPTQIGGSQEQSLRGGTENIPAIAGLGKAASLARKHLTQRMETAEALKQRLWGGLQKRIESITRHSPQDNCLPGTLNVSLTGVPARELVRRMDEHGFCIATGSACSTGKPTPSAVLKAIGCDDETALASIRLSVGEGNTVTEIDRFLDVLPEIVNELRTTNAS